MFKKYLLISIGIIVIVIFSKIRNFSEPTLNFSILPVLFIIP